MAGTARLFVALWPPPNLRAALLAHQAMWCWNAGASRVPPDKLHLTLHFLGAVPRERVAQVAEGLEMPFMPFLPFTLDLVRPELWGAGLAVLKPHTAPAGLLQLHAALGQALRQLELPVESRVFSPHITLARHAAGATPPTDAPALRWPVQGYALVESQAHGAGRYEVLRRYA